MIPDTLITLANLGLPRRPAGAPAPSTEPALPTAAAATRQLASLIPRRVTTADLAGLRRLQRIAAGVADALERDAMPDVAGPDLAALNRLARDSTAHVELVVRDGTLRRELVWDDRSVTGHLARRLVDQLAQLEPGRLRRCERIGCDLFFYDTTRSRTRRWHAEDPCGWRERQESHRARR